jgi:uncharacterized protein
MRPLASLLVLLGAAPAFAVENAPSAAPGVTFESWSDDLFARARAEHRYVILDLAAVWCHWCHVMEATTYRDPAVVTLVGARFIAVRADQDADPELSRRYEDWGWPATIVFAPDGSEIVKRRGYLPPPLMASMLQAIVDDPSPGPSVRPEPRWRPSTATRVSPAARRALERTFVAAFDGAHAGWGTVHKFLDPEPVEFALGDRRYQTMARRTLDAALALIDPVWGGMYQYSDAVDWSSPHFEKIMSVQAGAIELYVRAYATWHDPRHRDAARAVARYLTTILSSPDGAFYVSQDADLDATTLGKSYYAHDDAGRRALGMPRVDTHEYARENGWAITALAELAAVDTEGPWLAAARRAAAWVEAHRRRADGTYAHGDHDRAGPYLGDTLAMAEAYAALDAVDPSGPWRGRAVAAARAIDARFAGDSGDSGYVTSAASTRPSRLVDENVGVARLAAHLARATGDASLGAIGDRAMHFLTSPTLLEERPLSPGVLVADRERAR